MWLTTPLAHRPSKSCKAAQTLSSIQIYSLKNLSEGLANALTLHMGLNLYPGIISQSTSTAIASKMNCFDCALHWKQLEERVVNQSKFEHQNCLSKGLGLQNSDLNHF